MKGPNPFEFRRLFSILKGIAKGMHFLHTLKIAHRDLNLGNFMITRDFVVKVADFGYGEFFSNPDGTLTAGVGAPSFQAPEVTLQKYDLNCDIWSFAMVIKAIFDITLDPLPKLEEWDSSDPKKWFQPRGEEDPVMDDMLFKIGVFHLERFAKRREEAIICLPEAIKSWLQPLIVNCTHLDPKRRPSFSHILMRFFRRGLETDTHSMPKSMTREVDIESLKKLEMESHRNGKFSSPLLNYFSTKSSRDATREGDLHICLGVSKYG